MSAVNPVEGSRYASAMEMLKNATPIGHVTMAPTSSEPGTLSHLASAAASNRAGTISALSSASGAAIPAISAASGLSSASLSASAAIPNTASKIFRISPSPFTPVDELDDLKWTELDTDDFVGEAERFTFVAEPAPGTTRSIHHAVAAEAIDEAHDWLDRCCPAALISMEGAADAFDERGSDYEAKTALCCRRALKAVADVLYPPSESKPDRSGTSRNLGEKNYKNRLLRFLDQAKNEEGDYELANEEMDYLKAKLDHIVNRIQKAVHEEANARETRRVLLLTWAFLGELAQVAARS